MGVTLDEVFFVAKDNHLRWLQWEPSLPPAGGMSATALKERARWCPSTMVLSVCHSDLFASCNDVSEITISEYELVSFPGGNRKVRGANEIPLLYNCNWSWGYKW